MPRKAILSATDQATRERLGAAIRAASEARKLKPADLARACEVSLAHQYRIESGERTPDVLYLMKVSRLLGVTIDDLCWQDRARLSVPQVYSAKLTEAQNEACRRMEAVSNMPPTGLAELDAGQLTPKEFWRLNLMVAHDVKTTIQNIDFPVQDR